MKEKKPNSFYSKMSKEEWIEYGEKHHSDLSRTELQKKNKRFYLVGLKKGWLNDFAEPLKTFKCSYTRQIEKLIGEGTNIETICKSLYLDEDFRSARKVGAVLGLSDGTVHKYLGRAEVEVKDHRHRRDVLNENLKELYNEHGSTVIVGKIVGLSAASVAKRLKGLGVKLSNSNYDNQTSLLGEVLKE